MKSLQQLKEEARKEFDEQWEDVFPPRNGLYLKGDSPRFPNHKLRLESFIDTLITQAYEEGYRAGKESTRAEIERVIGGMAKKQVSEKPEIKEEIPGYLLDYGYNAALSDLRDRLLNNPKE